MITGSIKFDIDPIKNGEEVAKKLRRIALIKALNKAASPVKKAVVDNAPLKSGSLKKSIRIKVVNYNYGSTWLVFVGPKVDYIRKKRKKEIKPSRYAKIIEKGNERQRARPFLRPALEQTKAQYFQILQRELALQIDLALARQ